MRKPDLARQARDAWAAHHAQCDFCKSAPSKVCDVARELLAAALVEIDRAPK